MLTDAQRHLSFFHERYLEKLRLQPSFSFVWFYGWFCMQLMQPVLRFDLHFGWCWGSHQFLQASCFSIKLPLFSVREAHFARRNYKTSHQDVNGHGTNSTEATLPWVLLDIYLLLFRLFLRGYEVGRHGTFLHRSIKQTLIRYDSDVSWCDAAIRNQDQCILHQIWVHAGDTFDNLGRRRVGNRSATRSPQALFQKVYLYSIVHRTSDRILLWGFWHPNPYV